MAGNNELLKKLEKIWDLYTVTLNIEDEMDNYEPEDNYKRKVIVPIFPGKYNSAAERADWEEAIEHEEEDAVELTEMVYDRVYKPHQPEKPILGNPPGNNTSLADELKKKRGFVPLVAGFVAICSLISGGLFLGDLVTLIANIVILIACGAGILWFFIKYKSAKAADEEVTRMAVSSYETEKKEKEEKYKQAIKEYQDKLVHFEQAKTTFINEYIAWRDIYIKHLSEETTIEEELEKDRLAGVNRIYKEKYIPAKNNLDKVNDLISEDYLPVLDKIVSLIKSGRADGLKEAINLYEAIDYRERQLELQREIEEQRIYEEELRRQEEEHRYQQEMKYREAQERQRRYEEERREREAERRHKEEMDQREREALNREYQERERIRREELKSARIEREQKEKQWQAAKKQCQHCAHAGRCSMSVYNNTPTCTGFTPK